MTLLKIRDQVIYKSREHGNNYNTFPSAVLTKDGNIVVGFRQARDMRHRFGGTEHYDPASRASALISRDEGKTFSLSLIYDDFVEGVQDPSLNLLRDGSLFGTFFCWTVQNKSTTAGLEHPSPEEWSPYDARYIARLAQLYTIRSTDGGLTWDKPLPVSKERLALRGVCAELSDGAILLPAYRMQERNCWKVCIHRSEDRGKTWRPVATLDHPPHGVNETSLFVTASGKVVAFLRSSYFERGNPATAPLLTAESHDNGATWSKPLERKLHSPSPFHPLQLQSGRVLVSYGYRFAPFGIRAVLLDGECEQWDTLEEVVLREDGQDEDLGYTSAVQLSNGEIWIFYYMYDSDGYRYIAATICREA